MEYYNLVTKICSLLPMNKKDPVNTGAEEVSDTLIVIKEILLSFKCLPTPPLIRHHKEITILYCNSLLLKRAEIWDENGRVLSYGSIWGHEVETNARVPPKRSHG